MQYPQLEEFLNHGSDVSFERIDLSKSVSAKDFGAGFYTTNSYEQAKKFAQLKARRSQSPVAFVHTYRLAQFADLIIKEFPAADFEWFDFVLRNRGVILSKALSEDDPPAYDIVIGPVANDAVGTVLNNYLDGVYGAVDDGEAKATAVRLLLSQRLNNQVFFATQKAVDSLAYIGTDSV